MINTLLKRKEMSLSLRLTIQTIISIGLIALAVGLPQLLHATLGASGGVRYLPMYLPILIGGCLLGWKWGLGVGLASPLVSYLITSGVGTAMPSAERLPFMMFELIVLALVSGLFSQKMERSIWWIIPTIIIAQIVSRGTFLLAVLVFQNMTSLTVTQIWHQIQAGWVGLVIQLVVVPPLVWLIRRLMSKASTTNE